MQSSAIRRALKSNQAPHTRSRAQWTHPNSTQPSAIKRNQACTQEQSHQISQGVNASQQHGRHAIQQGRSQLVGHTLAQLVEHREKMIQQHAHLPYMGRARSRRRGTAARAPSAPRAHLVRISCASCAHLVRISCASRACVVRILRASRAHLARVCCPSGFGSMPQHPPAGAATEKAEH